jgi:hypothetical protein
VSEGPAAQVSSPQEGTRALANRGEQGAEKQQQPGKRSDRNIRVQRRQNEEGWEEKKARLLRALREAIDRRDYDLLCNVGDSILQFGGRGIELLKEVMLKDPYWRMRSYATRALGRLKRAELGAVFAKVVMEDTSEHVRLNAAWALGQLRRTDGDLLRVLQKVAKEDPSPTVREQASMFLD